MAMNPAPRDEAASPARSERPGRQSKVMRIGAMTHQLLEEVRQLTLDEGGRARLREIYDTSVRELADILPEELREELCRLALPFEEGEVPSQDELRLAQAQLQGWMQGLFQGIQASLMAQAQLGDVGGGGQTRPPDERPSRGAYL